MEVGYELLDLGQGKKLERFGTVVLARPAPQATSPRASGAEWAGRSGEYVRDDSSGVWVFERPFPQPWIVRTRGFDHELRTTSSGQVGFFPEQEPIRARISELLEQSKRDELQALDLFAYTGGSTMVLARGGATVTWVDSSQAASAWTRRNLDLNALAGASVRRIVEHAPRFVARELRRHRKYDAIVLDPPSFGRGTKGEAWKIEQHLDELLAACRGLLSPSPLFVVATAHTESWTSSALGSSLDRAFGTLPGETEHGVLQLATRRGQILPSGVFALRTFHD
jgi:23S rRNA (cytosine1962-C5)-methyltransferase